MHTTTRSAGELARRGADRLDVALAVADERLDRGVEVHLHAHLGPRLLHRSGDVGVGGLGQGPRLGIDDVGLDAAVSQGGDHLETERRGLHHDGYLRGVENLVPLHGPADVLHEVEPVEVASGHAGIGVVETRRR